MLIMINTNHDFTLLTRLYILAFLLTDRRPWQDVKAEVRSFQIPVILYVKNLLLEREENNLKFDKNIVAQEPACLKLFNRLTRSHYDKSQIKMTHCY